MDTVMVMLTLIEGQVASPVCPHIFKALKSQKVTTKKSVAE